MSVAEELRHRARLALLRARRGKTTDVNPRVRSVSVEKASWWSQRLGVPVAPGTPTAALPKTAEIDDVLSLEPRQREAYLRLRQAGGSHERAMRDARGLGGDTPTPAKATPAKATPRKATAPSAEQRRTGGFPAEAPPGFDQEAWSNYTDAQKRQRLEQSIRAHEREIREQREQLEATLRWALSLPDSDPRKNLYLREEGPLTRPGELQRQEREIARLQERRDRLRAILEAAGDAGREPDTPQRRETTPSSPSTDTFAERRRDNLVNDLNEIEAELGRLQDGFASILDKPQTLGRLSRLEREARELNDSELAERVAALRRRAESIPSPQERESAAAARRREALIPRTSELLDRMRQRFSGNANDRAVLDALANNGWRLVGADGPGSYTFESPDGQRQLNVFTDSPQGRPRFGIPGRTRETMREIREHVGATATPAKAAPRKAAAASAEQRQRQAREWARRYERGESISQIAASEGVSYSTVHSRLTKDAGIQLRPRGARKATPAKAAPAKATPAAAAPAASGLSSDPEVRAAQVRNSIIEAYHQLRGEERSGWVSLARLRDRLSPELSREEVDQALRTLFRRPGISMVPEVGNRDERLSAAAIRIGGEDRHLISIDSRRLDDVPEGTPRAPAVVGDRSVVTPQGSRPTGEPPRTPEYGREVENAIRDAYSQLLARRNREVGDWVSIAEIREVLGDRYPREDVDNALARLNRQSGVNMVPEFDQTVLSREQRTGAIVLGGQSRHLIAFESSALRDRASAQQWSLDDLTPSQRQAVSGLSAEQRRVYEARRDAGISHDLALRDARQVAPRARGEESARDVRDRLERQWGYRPSASQVLQRVSDDELRRLLFDDRERESLGISVNDISQEQSSRSAGAQQLRDFGVEAFDPAREGAPRPTGRGERGSVVQFPRRTTPATAGSGGGEVTDLSDYRRALAQGLSPRDAAAYAAWLRRNPGGSIAQWRAQRQGPISQEDFIVELDNKGLSARRLRQLAESVGLEPPTWVRSQAELTLWLAQNRDHPGLREAIAALPGPRRSAGFVEASDLAMALTRLPDEQAIVRRLTEIGANVSQLRRVARELNIGIPETPPSGSRWTAAALRQHLARIIVRDRGRFSWR